METTPGPSGRRQLQNTNAPRDSWKLFIGANFWN